VSLPMIHSPLEYCKVGLLFSSPTVDRRPSQTVKYDAAPPRFSNGLKSTAEFQSSSRNVPQGMFFRCDIIQLQNSPSL
jgi:hypothetical protein